LAFQNGPSRTGLPERAVQNVPSMTDTLTDPDFLALLVHHGRLTRERASGLLARCGAGESMDLLVGEALDLTPAAVAKLRRTRCGERPELPGYRLEQHLGRGGSADVWRAVLLETRSPVALKVLRAELSHDPRQVRAFVAEARLLERLDHEGLVRCHGVARCADTYFMRLELIDGLTLLQHLERSHAFPEAEALRIVLDVARALEHLEEQGVVHRDVKPGNVMLRRNGRAVLIDLGFAVELEPAAGGLARAAAEGAAEGAATPAAAGTVAYLSPEEAAGSSTADCRSDIYSLGVSLFHLLVGRLPFEGQDRRELLEKHIFASLDGPELRGRNVSPHTQYFIEKMMAKDANDRYQSWAELIRDVSAQLEGRAAFARDPQLPPNRPRSGRRRRS
jgi:serine/threonine protein kinase